MLFLLQNIGLCDKLLNSVKAIYKTFISCVRTNDGLTDFFNCSIGLRQGCVLSPILFSLFINELANEMVNKCDRGIQMTPDLTDIFLLLFADDVVLFSDTRGGLQKQLNILYNYCQKWKLTVNLQKTKVVVFRHGGQLSQTEKLVYGKEKLNVISQYSYLGILFTSHLSLSQLTSYLAIKGKRALMEVLRTMFRFETFTYDVFFKVFDAQILPILLYGSEIWGFKHFECIERVQYLACKRFLNVSKYTPNVMALGECGRYPIYRNSIIRCIQYWIKLIQMPEWRYPRKAYNMLYSLDCAERYTWATSVKNILFSFGFGYVWISQDIGNKTSFLFAFKQRVSDIQVQDWISKINSSSRYDIYSKYKLTLEPECYLIDYSLHLYRKDIARIRVGGAGLLVDKGRHIGLNKSERICTLCNTNAIEN